MKRSSTVELTPTRLVPVLIPDQPRTGTHRFAADCIAGPFNGRLGHPSLCGPGADIGRVKMPARKLPFMIDGNSLGTWRQASHLSMTLSRATTARLGLGPFIVNRRLWLSL